MATLRKLGDEGRERIAAEREQAQEAEARATRAEDARDRAEKASSRRRPNAQGDREALAVELSIGARSRSREVAGGGRRARRSAKRRQRHDEALRPGQARGRPARGRGRAARGRSRGRRRPRRTSLRYAWRPRSRSGSCRAPRTCAARPMSAFASLVEKVEGEATEMARARAEEALKAESERIRAQAEQREDRVRRRPRTRSRRAPRGRVARSWPRPMQTAPSWARREASPFGLRLPNLLDRDAL